jgi:ParB-like chromosome segregation protein Spo0J
MNSQNEFYLLDRFKEFAIQIGECELDQKVKLLNECRKILHQISPFKNEPVDLVQWVSSETVHANNYNPNSVAKPEMELLKLSIQSSGYTQPIVTMNIEQGREVIDGFHRHLCGKNDADISARIQGYLPVVTIREEQTDITDRMAATVQHNRARGKHSIDGMSDIVIDLKRRNWSDSKISKHLGMDQDEVLRLTQITGLAEAFKDHEFSMAWEPEFLEEDVIEKIDG